MSSLWACAAREIRESTRSAAQPALALARLVSATTWPSTPDPPATARGVADGVRDGVAEGRGVADGVDRGVADGVRVTREPSAGEPVGRSATSAAGVPA